MSVPKEAETAEWVLAQAVLEAGHTTGRGHFEYARLLLAGLPDGWGVIRSELLEAVLVMERHNGKELRETYPFSWELVRRAAGLPAITGDPK